LDHAISNVIASVMGGHTGVAAAKIAACAAVGAYMGVPVQAVAAAAEAGGEGGVDVEVGHVGGGGGADTPVVPHFSLLPAERCVGSL
jgi:hypothetical protein